MKTWEALKAAEHFGSKSSNHTNYIKVDDVDWDEVFATDWEIYEEEENERTE